MLKLLLALAIVLILACLANEVLALAGRLQSLQARAAALRRRLPAVTGALRLEPVVRAAVALHRSHAPRLFTVGAFAYALRAEFGLAELPAHPWCRAVLEQIPFVVSTGTSYLWLYRPEVMTGTPLEGK